MLFREYSYCLILFVLITSVSFSQTSFNGEIINYETEYSIGYVKPLVESIGESVTSGWSSYMPMSKDQFGFDAGVQSSLIFVSDEQRTFNTVSPYSGQVQTVPTIFGENTEVPVSIPNINPAIKIYPDKYLAGYNYDILPLFVPQLTAGNIFGTRLMFRFIPKIKLFNFGFVSSLGFGVQHSFNRYIKNMPIDISVTAAYQNVKFADIVSSNSYIISAQLFKNFPFVTLYSDFGYKHTNASFEYNAYFIDPENPEEKITKRINFDVNGKNTFRAVIGASLNLYVVKLNFGYTVTSPQIFTFGLGLGLIR